MLTKLALCLSASDVTFVTVRLFGVNSLNQISYRSFCFLCSFDFCHCSHILFFTLRMWQSQVSDNEFSIWRQDKNECVYWMDLSKDYIDRNPITIICQRSCLHLAYHIKPSTKPAFQIKHICVKAKCIPIILQTGLCTPWTIFLV